MSKTFLEIVVAGAGAGKTENLCKTVCNAISAGLDPSRILATTFTKKAAAELKGRLQAHILNEYASIGDDAIKQAEKLEFASIGTVHSVGFHLIKKFACHLGISPRIRLLPENSEKENLRNILPKLNPDYWQNIIPLTNRLGIEDNELNNLLLNLVDLKRSNCIDDETFKKDMKDGSQKVCELLGTANDLTSNVDSIKEVLTTTLGELNKLNDDTKTTNTAKENISKVLAKGQFQWSDYAKINNIKAGKTSGADSKLNPLRAISLSVRNFKSLHDDVNDFCDLITRMTLDLEKEYSDYKNINCQTDYSDLLLLFLKLLEQPEIEKYLREEYDLILVDEFQDSHPLDLAIFSRLRNLTKRNRWVGDPNQSIYSFRGTDPNLLLKILENSSADSGITSETIPSNYRSQKGLVQLFGKIFENHLGKNVLQTPKKKESKLGIERWILQCTNKSQDLYAIAKGVFSLVNEGICPSEIAVLSYTNNSVNELASILNLMGIPTLASTSGLLKQRECSIVLAGMRLVADKKDTLSAANILHHLNHTENDAAPKWTTDILQASRNSKEDNETDEVADGKENDAKNKKTAKGTHSLENHPVLAKIFTLDAKILSPYMVLVEVIQALGITENLGSWKDPCNRMGCLDSLLEIAKTFENESLEKGNPATLSELILCLEEMEKNDQDMLKPTPGKNAITLLTYHKGKGLAWPIVILNDLNKDFSTEPWYPEIVGHGEIDNPLQGKTLRHWQWPFGRTEQMGWLKINKGTGLEDSATASTEANDLQHKLDQESIRLLYVGFTRAKERVILPHRSGSHQWLDKIPDLANILDENLPKNTLHSLKSQGIETNYLIKEFDPTPIESSSNNSSSKNSWLKTKHYETGSYLARFHNPSSMTTNISKVNTTSTDLGENEIFPSRLQEDDFPKLGLAVHAFLGSIPSLKNVDEKIRIKHAENCLNNYSMTGFLNPQELINSGNAFIRWVNKNFPDSIWHVEVPISCPKIGGGQWNGTIDLILELTTGDLIVIDHKSSPIRKTSCIKKAESYFGQISAYKEILTHQNHNVKETYIHFPLASQMIKISEK